MICLDNIVKRPSSGGMMRSKEAGRADDWGSIPQGSLIQWRPSFAIKDNVQYWEMKI